MVLDGVQTYEVDIKATQMAKKRHLRKLFGTLPAQVSFVEMDFTHDSLSEQLLAAGFDTNLRTLFILEGVIYYLPETVVREVLSEIRALAMPESRIVFDYILTAGLAGDETLYGAKEAMQIWNEMGEPGLFGLEHPAAAEQFMAELEFEVISDLTPARWKSATIVQVASSSACISSTRRIGAQRFDRHGRTDQNDAQLRVPSKRRTIRGWRPIDG